MGLDWQQDAECKGMSGIFFPSEAALANVVAAVCQLCPVVEQCREHAIEFKPEWGVWAGELWKGGKIVKIPPMPMIKCPCGTEFPYHTTKGMRPKFCSTPCRQKYGYRRGK